MNHGRPPLGLIVLLAAVLAFVPAPAAAAPCWPPPTDAAVVDPFREPTCRWCPGNRGIEYATPAGAAVRAIAAGVVSFAGAVAGDVYVVVRLGNGWRITYGALDSKRVATGDVVVAGSLLGDTAGHLHLGLRDGDRYIDPAPYLGRLVGVVRLVPADGSPPAPAPPPRLRCGV